MERDGIIVPGRDEILDRLVNMSVDAGAVDAQSDRYFSNTSQIVRQHGSAHVTYAVFMRCRVIAALEPVIRLVKRLVPAADIKRYYQEGDIIPSESKMLEISGPFEQLSEIETLALQKIGFPCVSANNAFEMCCALPQTGFVDMHARHASGAEMNILAAYGAALGSGAARRFNPEVKGFLGSSQNLTAPFFGMLQGFGTMPHALIGYTQGDVLEALKLFSKYLPEEKMLTALVDYQGQEITDSLRCAKWFYAQENLQNAGKKFSVRLDTHGGRFAEGLDYERSVDVVGQWLGIHGEYNIVETVLGGRAFQLDPVNILIDKVRRILFGKGVSVACVIHARQELDAAGFKDVMIVGSSGFDLQKCIIMGASRAPLDLVGSGSFLPSTLTETYATADIIKYSDESRVKVGREFLLD